MSEIPLYINLPVAPSVDQILSALRQNPKFCVFLIPFDQEVLKLIANSKPCAAIFSIIDQDTYASTFEQLGHMKRLHMIDGVYHRDPALRTILVAEHWSVTLERWMEVGIHEFIPAPISPRALTFKLERQHTKALSASAA